MKRIVILIIFFGMICSARLRGNDGGGGILQSAEFASTGRGALEILTKGDTSLKLNDILSQIADVKVIPVETLCYKEPIYNKEYCQDAHYDRTNNVILFVYQNWDVSTCSKKLLLSAHEYLRAAGLESEDYRISGRFLTGELAQCRKKPGSKEEQINCADLSQVLSNQVEELCRSLNWFGRSRNP